MSTEIELSEKPRGTVIKLEPAFALADGKALEPTKSEPVRIGRGISITQGFERHRFLLLAPFPAQ